MSKKQKIARIIASILMVAFFGFTLVLVSCNVTRTITTQSQYYVKGDTTCTIITKLLNNMTQVKSNINLREQFQALPKKEQDAVINFFNLHNAAIWIYNFLTEDAQVYVNNCINFSQKTQEELETEKE